MTSIDTEVLHFFVHQRHPWLTTVAQAVTTLGSSAVLIPLVVVAGLGWRWARRSWVPLLLLAASYAGAEALFQVLKAIIGRPRPPLTMAVGSFTGSAFPSGHATLSAAVWGMLAALVTRGRRTARLVSALLALLIGVTRLYLGAHWLTDVLAGWAIGALWLATLLVGRAQVGRARLAGTGRVRLRAGTSSRQVSP